MFFRSWSAESSSKVVKLSPKVAKLCRWSNCAKPNKPSIVHCILYEFGSNRTSSVQNLNFKSFQFGPNCPSLKKSDFVKKLQNLDRLPQSWVRFGTGSIGLFFVFEKKNFSIGLRQARVQKLLSITLVNSEHTLNSTKKSQRIKPNQFKCVNFLSFQPANHSLLSSIYIINPQHGLLFK